MRLMDRTETRVEMAEGGLPEPLVIIEEGDVTKGVAETGAASSSQSCSGASALKKEEEHEGEDKNEASVKAKMCSERWSLEEKRQTSAEDSLTGDAVVDEDTDRPEEIETVNRCDDEGEGQKNEAMRVSEEPEEAGGAEDEKIPQNVAAERLDSLERQPEGTQSQEEEPQKVCGLFFFYGGMSHEIIMTQFTGEQIVC